VIECVLIVWLVCAGRGVRGWPRLTCENGDQRRADHLVAKRAEVAALVAELVSRES